MQRIVRLSLTGRPTPGWVDAFRTSPAEPPYIIQGAAAVLEFALMNTAESAMVSPSGITDITVEIYRERTGNGSTAAIIAPAVVQVETAGLTLETWEANASPGSTSGRHFGVELAGSDTNVSFLSNEDALMEAWMEVYGTYDGDRVHLGAGPIRIHRSSAGATPQDPVSQYYTAAQVTALLADRPEVTVSGGVASMVIDGTTYSWPVGTAS